MEKKKLKSIELFKNDEINNLKIIKGGRFAYGADGVTVEQNDRDFSISWSCEEPGVLGPGWTSDYSREGGAAATTWDT